ncbi:n-acetyltransferase [Blastocystis sp. subtype 4]|uniref:n-acetyltransferase n=1 Tax=Blastocystis sp. subtype 4 TaxID=944170 RepID=UPI00071226AA|nr:n-acetyltransferase [Blastocystis sp. subtype 4]KNB45699.1 n-acetyltransferase [Blastocystis sp. subtype 4]|eukprot:XP_014529142.1 n-acetyltransferase [Blastocystis sp. subtype 4]
MIPLGDMGEFNVMIADKKDRRKGNRYLKLKDFFVKINKDNIPSIKMFEKIGFTFYHFNHHFDENEYRLVITNDLSKRWIMELGLPIKM